MLRDETAARCRRVAVRLWAFALIASAAPSAHTGARAQVLNDPVDVAQDFQRMENVYFVGSKVTAFDPATGAGTLQWDRYLRGTTLSFNKIDMTLGRGKGTEFPGTEYDQDPALPFFLRVER